jgi:hypothetical protein
MSNVQASSGITKLDYIMLRVLGVIMIFIAYQIGASIGGVVYGIIGLFAGLFLYLAFFYDFMVNNQQKMESKNQLS